VVAQNVAAWDGCASRVESSFPLDLLDLESVVSADDFVLDIGCGNGRLLMFMKLRGFRNLHGIDPSTSMVAVAASRHPEVSVAWMDDPLGPFAAAASVDVALLVGVLSSVPTEAAREDLLRRVVLTLKPGGRLVVADFLVTQSEYYEGRYAAGCVEPFSFLTQDGIVVHHFLEAEIRSLLGGFMDVGCVKTCDVVSLHGRPLRGLVAHGTLRQEIG
jgi:SAM-dependent methyltransferase